MLSLSLFREQPAQVNMVLSKWGDPQSLNTLDHLVDSMDLSLSTQWLNFGYLVRNLLNIRVVRGDGKREHALVGTDSMNTPSFFSLTFCVSMAKLQCFGVNA
jgi:hypothetical protein